VGDHCPELARRESVLKNALLFTDPVIRAFTLPKSANWTSAIPQFLENGDWGNYYIYIVGT